MISVTESFMVASELFLTKLNVSLPKTKYLYLHWSFFFHETDTSELLVQSDIEL